MVSLYQNKLTRLWSLHAWTLKGSSNLKLFQKLNIVASLYLPLARLLVVDKRGMLTTGVSAGMAQVGQDCTKWDNSEIVERISG